MNTKPIAFIIFTTASFDYSLYIGSSTVKVTINPIIHTPTVLDILVRQRVSASKYFVIAIPLAFDTKIVMIPTITRIARTQSLVACIKNSSNRYKY